MNFYGKLISAGILLFVVLACNLSANNNQKPTNTSGVKTEPKVLGEFTNRLKMVNKYVLVQKGLTDAQLIELAKDMHRKEPAVTFWFLDDDSKSAEMMTWVHAYAEGEADTTDPITNWMSEHIVANLQQYFREGGRYWALSKGMMGDKIAEIE
ncbi:MAG: hypothetical protein WAQ99_21435 [Pyrinomonadaceae bacterium]